MLGESAELYRLLTEHSTDMISKHTPEGFYTYASPACRSLLGYDPEELVGRDAYEFFHPNDLEEIKRTHSAILERPDTYTAGYRIRRKDGSYTWFETTSRTVRNPDTGEVLEIVTVSRDITELTVGPDGAAAAEEIMEVLRAGGTWEGEFAVRRRDGSTFPAHVTDSLIRDAEGRPVGIVGVSTDITERKRTEEELRESEERFRAFFETAAVGTAHADPATGGFLQVNEKLCRFLGYDREELLSMTFSDITHPDDRTRGLEGLSRMLRGEIREYVAEKRYVRKDGQTVWGQLAVSLVRDGDGRALHTVAITQDTTEHKRLKEGLREIREAERRRIARDLHDVVLQDLAGALQDMQAAQKIEPGGIWSPGWRRR
jgi:PAS domain S-box-containing protein